jgi:hypothetical protein
MIKHVLLVDYLFTNKIIYRHGSFTQSQFLPLPLLRLAFLSNSKQT